jgi:DNA-directed RNA polymerase specialized sigma24 family protein
MDVLHVPPDADERFAETAWSIVLAAGAATPARAREGMAQLCSIYWRPIYGYLRRIGYAKEEAEDLTQSFFQHLLENDTLRRASREKGRFRSFLLGALQVCLSDEKARSRTLKRGGGAQFISTDELETEELYHLRAFHEAAPDEILDARWASVILERALTKVRGEFSGEGKAETFEVLSSFLSGEKASISYEQAAKTTGVSLGAIKTHIHRLRRQFAAAVRHEIMQTVSAPHEVDDELRHFRDVFARFGHQQAA